MEKNLIESYQFKSSWMRMMMISIIIELNYLCWWIFSSFHIISICLLKNIKILWDLKFLFSQLWNWITDSRCDWIVAHTHTLYRKKVVIFRFSFHSFFGCRISFCTKPISCEPKRKNEKKWSDHCVRWGVKHISTPPPPPLSLPAFKLRTSTASLTA